MNIRINWMLLVPALSLLIGLGVAFVLWDESRQSWAVAVPLVSWLVSSGIAYLAALAEEER